MSIGEIRALAESVCQPTFAHVRRTLIELLNVAPEIRRRLLERFQKPADSQKESLESWLVMPRSLLLTIRCTRSWFGTRN
jgi:hypothetical protein